LGPASARAGPAPNAVDLAMDLLLSRPANTGENQPITIIKP